MKKPKTLKGVKRAEFCQMIVKTTARIFATMLNPGFVGPNWKFTPENITRLTWTGFYACGYDKNDLIVLYPGLPDTLTLEKFWEQESRKYAKELIEHSGLSDVNTIKIIKNL